MEFLDIAVASAYASVCLTVIILVNPVAAREAAVEAADQTSLDTAIAGYVNHVGLPFLAAAPLPALCASAEAAGNSTLALGIVANGAGCAGTSPPDAPLASSTLSLQLPGRTVEISAWLARP